MTWVIRGFVTGLTVGRHSDQMLPCLNHLVTWCERILLERRPFPGTATNLQKRRFCLEGSN
jgi:hypothetical protein